MANAICSVCSDVLDTRAMHACPQCMEYLCTRCGGDQGGLCPNCDAPEE